MCTKVYKKHILAYEKWKIFKIPVYARYFVLKSKIYHFKFYYTDTDKISWTKFMYQR